MSCGTLTIDSGSEEDEWLKRLCKAKISFKIDKLAYDLKLVIYVVAEKHRFGGGTMRYTPRFYCIYRDERGRTILAEKAYGDPFPRSGVYVKLSDLPAAVRKALENVA